MWAAMLGEEVGTLWGRLASELEGPMAMVAMVEGQAEVEAALVAVVVAVGDLEALEEPQVTAGAF